MDVSDIRAIMSAHVRAAWPQATKASGLPFPMWWKAQLEWLAFHAPHCTRRFVETLVRDFVKIAKKAEADGCEPQPWVVPEEVRDVWERAARGEYENVSIDIPEKTEMRHEKPRCRTI